jgi:hypothetical protein
VRLLDSGDIHVRPAKNAQPMDDINSEGGPDFVAPPTKVTPW